MNKCCKKELEELNKKIEEIYQACNNERIWEIQARLSHLLVIISQKPKEAKK